ncbi:MAG TPA: GNAT family N-acetyltransferase [Bacteroidia bacterium]|nr:GNAT family N-acetyltransferase [Bacteroidia bacterium]
MLRFESARLRFRDMEMRDTETMIRLNSDPEVIRYTGDPPFVSVESAHAFFAERIAAYKKHGYGRWITELKSSGEIIGWCGLKLHEDTGETDLGYRFFRAHWGKGYATEGAKATIAFGCRTLGLTRIVAHARKENSASLRVLQKCGMKIIGEGVDCDGEIYTWEIQKSRE